MTWKRDCVGSKEEACDIVKRAFNKSGIHPPEFTSATQVGPRAVLYGNIRLRLPG
jgi:hypothetical protein